MNRARTFPASASFTAMAGTLATQIADLETSNGGDETDDPLTQIFSATEMALTRMPVNNVGDLLLKLEILAQIAEDSTVDAEEWQARTEERRAGKECVSTCRSRCAMSH